jgi:capsular exopolysaccharide synthesis family protein
MFRSRKPPTASVPAQSPAGSDVLVVVERAVDPLVVLFHDSAGFRAEQFRGLRNKLIAMNPDGAAKTLVITSAIRGEGKTVTAINLAMAFGELDQTPVLLVDADMRSSAVERYLNLNPQAGFADVLMGTADLQQAVRRHGIRNLSIMGSGTKLTGPSELITAPRINALFDRLKERFMYVIVDTPPVLPATDASVMAARADGTLLVVRLEHSSKTLTKEAVRNLSDLGANLLGTFVTEVRGADPEADRRLADRDEGA